MSLTVSSFLFSTIILTGTLCLVDALFWMKLRKKRQQSTPILIEYNRSIFIISAVIGIFTTFDIDFPLFLTMATTISGLIVLFDRLILSKKRKDSSQKMPIIIDYSRSFFPILLIVLMIRSFIIQPFRVPTGSLEPTVLPNDFVAVNQFAYGLRLPVWNKKILSIGHPKRGDIAVFRYPIHPRIDYVKRVIGLPGDHIVYRHKTLMINGEEISQSFLRNGIDFEPPNTYIPAEIKEENLKGLHHEILLHKIGGDFTDIDVIVPSHHYFVMGDNRDNSADSRYWGFVPEKNLIGKAFIIWMSWDSSHHHIRFSRIGKKL